VGDGVAAKRLSEKSLSLNFYIKLKHMVETKQPQQQPQNKIPWISKVFHYIEQNIIYVPNILIVI
jgi:hypothetical protein